ncbi:MAG: DUF3187 family protein [Desulfobacterales bacterium]|nr:DUF3187 family protein [Desulfobacterales bacterium]MBF0397196.1 DUF3187 family protein [Desulfobacterales bacterium]
MKAYETFPFQTRNESPLVQIFAIPNILNAEIVSEKELSTQVTFNIINNFINSKTKSEELFLDSEIYKLNLSVNYGLAKGMDIGITIPYLFSSGGILDSSIENWHKTFSFPEGQRINYPRNQFHYMYNKNGNKKFDIYDTENSIGDISLSFGYEIFKNVALRGSVKIPTADEKSLTGSGGTDFSFYFAGKNKIGIAHIYGDAGFIVTGKSYYLSDERKTLVGFGTIGLGIEYWDYFIPKIQIDLHSPFYHSSLKEIGSYAGQVVIGGTIFLSKKSKMFLDIGIIEDIIVTTAPDVVFHFSFGKFF